MTATMRRLAAGLALSVPLAAVPASAATTAALLRCQKGIGTRAAAIVKSVTTSLSNCAYRVEVCQLAQEIDGTDPTACLALAANACAAYSAKIPPMKASALAKALLACSAVPVADVDPWIAGLGLFAVRSDCGAASMTDLLTCLFDAAQCAGERILFTLDPRAQDALGAAGVLGAHPCVGP